MDKKKIKILLISFGVLPSKGGSAFIVENLAANFTKDQMAVVGEKLLFNKSKTSRNEKMPNFYYVSTQVTFRGRGKRFLLAFRWLLFPYLLFKLSRIYRKEQCNYILAVFPDNYYLCASYLLARLKRSRYSSYFHNTYLDNRKGIHRFFAAWLQPKVFNLSEAIFVMSKGMEDYYKSIYYLNKVKPLVHSFNEYPILQKTEEAEDKKSWKLLLIGNFNPSNLEATQRFVNAVKNYSSFEVYICTMVPKWMLKVKGIDVDNIHYMGYVKDEDFYNEIQKYDIFILTHGFHGGYSEMEYKTIFPTRTIPFLISGKPIFAHSPKNSFLTRFLNEHDCAEVVDEASEVAIVNRLNALICDKNRRETLVRNAMETSKMFYGPNVAHYLISNLTNYGC